MTTLIYCYDAYCGWCYGFSEVIKKISSEYKNKIDIEVLSGGMILPEEPIAIGATAKYIKSEYKRVEELAHVRFGEDYLWHIKYPEMSDWFPNSEKPAIALCVFKDYYPDQQVSFVSDMQSALHFDGRDLTDDESYRLVLEKYNIPEEEFYEKLHDEEYKKQAYYEFDLCKQLKVTGFPTVLVQLNETKFFMVARGYTEFETLKERILNVLIENKISV